MLRATPQRTARMPRDEPTPMIAAEIDVGRRYRHAEMGRGQR